MRSPRHRVAWLWMMAAVLCSTVDICRADVPDPDEIDLSTPQGFMAGIGFDESYYKMFDDEQPLIDAEQEPLIRLLSRIRRPKPRQIEGWLQIEPKWGAYVEQPEASRLECFLLVGRVVKISSRPIFPELGAAYDLEDFYALEVIPRGGETGSVERVVLMSLAIPERFKPLVDQEEGAIDQPISAAAYFVKRMTPAGEQPATIAAVTQRVSWHPDQVDAQLGVNEGQVLLAAQGVDIGEFDAIRDRAPFSGRENESFYQTQAAVASVPRDQLSAEATPVSLPRLLTEPEQFRGAAMRVRGMVRRITKIVVDEETARRRGLDHYYEINLFVPLKAPIISQAHGDPTTRREFENSYPVVLCSRQLPPGGSVADDLHLTVVAEGFFYKDWAYRSPFMSDEDPNRRQVSPLFIVDRPQTIEDSSTGEVNSIAVWLLIFAVLASSLGIGAGVMLAGSRKRR
ncbi:hypothetical protein [Blastopirellula retiformator]|uniref:Uncharacterized protein n=1 Tax=Blastopirellula retiformator TaxID=2527970 RepID=A0A5C5V148_9BACT|nr:hypothetical protein [Blastopirellula retiformator]TWT31749.1 hypothetical protein Enr8_36730 [Blastopirellula retiformator]